MRSVLDGSVANFSHLFSCQFAAVHLNIKPFGVPQLLISSMLDPFS